MVKLFVCGSGSLHRQLEEEDDHHHHDIGSPRKPKKGSKNPFADSGLEKFSALLAELEEKKKQIYTQLGSEEIAFIRFDYSNSNRGKPIVVRVKGREKEKERDHKQRQDKDDDHMEISNIPAAVQVQESRPNKKVNNGQKKQSFSWDFLKRETWRKPSYYLPAVMILILFLVVLFGRSFAILCTSVGWYMIPAITGGESKIVKRVKKKKDYRRRASEKGMIVDREAARISPVRSSPVSVISGAMTEFSPEKHVHHRKSF